MALRYITLPLYSDADFSYNVVLENNSYNFRMYFNERVQGWFFELSNETGNLILAGERMVPVYPIMQDYALDNLSGFIWMEPIGGGSMSKFEEDPFNLSTWFRAWYVYDDGT